jgi:hypothetical protein
LPRGVEHRISRQFTELEAAAEAGDRLAFRVGVAFGYSFDALTCNIFRNVSVYFNENESAIAAVFGVLFKHGVASGS